MSQFSHTNSQTQRTTSSSMYSTNSLIYTELTNICEKNIVLFTINRAISYTLIFVFQPLSQLLAFSFLMQFDPEQMYDYAEAYPFLDLTVRLFPQCLYVGINPTIQKYLATNQSALACSKIFMHASLYVLLYNLILISTAWLQPTVYHQVAFYCSFFVSLDYFSLIFMLGNKEMFFALKNLSIFALQPILLHFVYFGAQKMRLSWVAFVEYGLLTINLVPAVLLFSQHALSLSFPVHLTRDGLRPFMPKLLLTTFAHFLENLGDQAPKYLMNYLAMRLTVMNYEFGLQYRRQQITLIYLYVTLQKLFIAFVQGSYYSVCYISSMCHQTYLYRKVHQIYLQAWIALFVITCATACLFFVIFRPVLHYFFSSFDLDSIDFARFAILTAPMLQLQAVYACVPSVFNKDWTILRDRYFMIALQFAVLIACVLIQYFMASPKSYCHGILCFDLTCAFSYFLMYLRSLRYIRRLRQQEVPKIETSTIDASRVSAVESKASVMVANAKMLSYLPINSMLNYSGDNASGSAQNNSNTVTLNPDSYNGLSNHE